MTRTIRHKIEELYEKSIYSFEGDYAYYDAKGGILDEDGFYAMFEVVGSGWLVHLLVTEVGLGPVLARMPYFLPKIGWARNAKGRQTIHWYDTKRMITLCTQ